MSNQLNSNSQSFIQFFENSIFIPNIYDNALNFFFKLEFNFLSCNSDYIDLITFQSYLDIPFLFSKRLFNVFSNNKKILSKDNFIKYLSIIFFGFVEEKIKFLFTFLSFKNELINKNDLKIFLNNLILDLSSNFDNYEKDLEEYIDYIFSFSNLKDNLNYEEFKIILTNYDSGLFYIFYVIFFNYKKFNYEILSFLNNYLIKQTKKNTTQITFSKTNLDCSTTITNSEIHFEIDNTNSIKKIPQRKTSTFKTTKKEINVIKKIQNNLLSIFKNIFPKINLSNDSEKLLKIYNEENEYSDDDSLNELNNFEKDIIDIKTNSFSEEIKNSLITESAFSPTTNKSKISNKFKTQITLSSSNSKFNNNDLNEYDSILVQFKSSNQIQHFHYVLFTGFFILFTHKKIFLIPYKRLYNNDLIDIKIKDNDFLCLEFISCINDFSFCLYFDNTFKLSYFQNTFLPKQNILYLNESYQLYEKKIIGKGKFSKVYLCQKYSNNQIYCIKEIERDFKCETPYKLNKKIINKEIDICEHFLKKINNNSIIHCEDVFETKDKVYIVFNYYNQGNLNDFFQKYYCFSLHSMNNERIIKIDNILNQLISTLKYIEKFGITHRDIKPENILVSFNSNLDLKIHLIDFGFADFGLYNQEMNSCLGTLVFTAPEIIMANFYYRNIDTWSLGILSFYLLFDNLPFDITNEDDVDSVKRKILQNKFSFPYNRIENNKYDKKIRKLILLCLIKENNKRPRISNIEYV